MSAPPKIRSIPPDLVQDVEPRLVSLANSYLQDAGNAFDALLTPNRTSQIEADVKFRTDADGVPSPTLKIANRLLVRPRAVIIGDLAPVDGHNYEPDETFIEPTLLNSHANYGAAWEQLRYRRHENGDVEIRGVWVPGANTTSIFVLPEGYWPERRQLFIVESRDTVGNVTPGRVDVDAAGTVYWFEGGPGPDYASMGGQVRFPSTVGPSTYRPVGQPIWSLTQRNQIAVERIPGLVPSTDYRATFVILP